jgi:hypothetical protein
MDVLSSNHNLIKCKLCEDFPQIYSETIWKVLKKHKYSYSQSYHYITDQIKQNAFRTKTKIYKKQHLQYNSELTEMFNSVNPSIECKCCYETKTVLPNFSPCSEGHLICNECIKTHAETTIYQQMISTIKCIDCTTNCNGVFTEQVLQHILDVRVFAEYNTIKVHENIKNIELYNDDMCIKMCQHCGACADIGTNQIQSHILICMECFKDTCLKCNQISHPGKPCHFQSINPIIRHKNEELQTANATFTCPKCNRTIVKDGGCNNIQCICGVHSCWICKQSHIDYTHFDYTHGDKCKLWDININYRR